MFYTKYDNAIEDLLAALKPIQEAVIELSKHNSNILIADATVIYVIEKLRSLGSSLSINLCAALVERYKARRLNVEVSLLHLLMKMEYPKETKDFAKCSKKDIKNAAVDLSTRLYPDPDLEASPEVQTDRDQDNTEQIEPLSLAKGIRQSLKPKVGPKVDFEKEFKMLEATNQLSPRLELVRDALLSIPPTSTICEQAFSVAESFKNKKRSCLGAKRTNALVWLKRYFSK